jgi:hypothetical protein
MPVTAFSRHRPFLQGMAVAVLGGVFLALGYVPNGILG